MKNLTRKFLLLSVVLWISIGTTMAAPVFTPESQPTGWVSRPVVSLYNLSGGGQTYYQIDFHKDTWAGDVLARDINKDAYIQSTGPWDEADPTATTAASILNGLNYSSERIIATNGGPFRWANMSLAEQTALGSAEVLNFIRGDRSNEEPDGMAFYQRESVLGDIIHSNLYFWDDGTHQTLFVGGNDGMLHAFDANTGIENFAYVPSMLIPRLGLLSNKTYVHSYFVDGPISIARMDLSGTLKTVLVATLGSGGAGLFALDVSSPTAASETEAASKVLWEIEASGSYANLGHVYGTPQLTRLNNGTAAVIIGNGYVNEGNGHAVLYVINAATGALISAIDTGSGSAASPNGLSAPTLYDDNGDGKPEYAYAGDIDGNMWKFDLTNFTSSLVWTTSPARAITTAPAVQQHYLGGALVNFATGRMLTSGDYLDGSVNYVYGIWDGAPNGTTTLVTQTLTSSTVNGISVRTVSDNALDWTTDKGWIIALPSGERVVGEKPVFNAGRFYFLTTNPTEAGGENWIHELGYLDGSSPERIIFDLDGDGQFLNDTDDLAANGSIPVAKFLGSGIFSQPLLVQGDGLATTLYAYHPDLPVSDGVPTDPDDPGVSGGHFDFDIYYYGPAVTVTEQYPTAESTTGLYCKKTNDVEKEYDSVATKACVENPNVAEGYTYLTGYTVGSICKDNSDIKKIEYNHTVTCNTTETKTYTSADYKKIVHKHEYDDKFDVTGVNMLNASLVDFNLANAILDPSTEFKVLVMNQYLNPAATLSLGGATYENVKTFENLASETNAATLINSLTAYSRSTVSTLIFNLPLDAFKSKDWWGDGGAERAGLIPTQTGCVNSINIDGSMVNDGGTKGLIGPQGERFDGALTIQIIKADTPAEALELNGPDVKYGWRVKQSEFTDWVLVEYTTFWHHPNKLCYGNDGWVADPPEDFEYKAGFDARAPGSADPQDGIFAEGLAFETVITTNGNVTTTTTTYSDDSQYIKIVTENDNGSTTIYQKFRDGTEETVTMSDGDGGRAGFVDPSNGSPMEELPNTYTGRQTWHEIVD